MLTERQRMVRETARRLAQHELAPGAGQRDRECRFPVEAFAKMGPLGLLGMLVPEEFGGAGADHVSYALAIMEIAAAGMKQFITSGGTADVAIVFAVTEPAAGKKGLSAFVVPTSTPGYRVAKVEETLGQRSTNHCQIVFDGCELLPDQMLGQEGEGLKIALSNLEGGRIGVAAQSVGMARAAYDLALAYAKERRTFGRSIIEHQAISFRLADMATNLKAAELMVLRAASLRDAGEPCLKDASMAKLFASETAEKVCSAAIQIHGGYGYINDFAVERVHRDVRACTIYEGTSDIQRLVIGRQIAAESAFQGVQ